MRSIVTALSLTLLLGIIGCTQPNEENINESEPLEGRDAEPGEGGPMNQPSEIPDDYPDPDAEESPDAEDNSTTDESSDESTSDATSVPVIEGPKDTDSDDDA